MGSGQPPLQGNAVLLMLVSFVMQPLMVLALGDKSVFVATQLSEPDTLEPQVQKPAEPAWRLIQSLCCGQERAGCASRCRGALVVAVLV